MSQGGWDEGVWGGLVEGLWLRLCLSKDPPIPRKRGLLPFQKTRGCQQGDRYVKSQLGHPQGWSISVKNHWVICVKSALLIFQSKEPRR